MSTRSLLHRRWRWPSIQRAAPMLIAWSGTAALIGLLASARETVLLAALAGIVGAIALAIVYRLCEIAASRWRHTHRGPIARMLPDFAADMWILGIYIYTSTEAVEHITSHRVLWAIGTVALGVAATASVIATRLRMVQQNRERQRRA